MSLVYIITWIIVPSIYIYIHGMHPVNRYSAINLLLYGLIYIFCNTSAWDALIYILQFTSIRATVI